MRHWFAMLWLAVAAQASDVRGRVAWTGTAPEGIIVEFGAAGESMSRHRARIDGMGEFTVPDVPAGEYELRVADSRGIVLQRRFVTVHSDEDFFSLRINPPRARRPVNGTVSAHALAHRSPAEARKEFDKGRQAGAKGDMVTAAERFAKAVELDPEFASAYANLGACYARLDRDAEALAAFQRASELDPGLRVVHTNMSQLLLRMKRYRAAEQSARAALRQQPSSEAAHFLLGASLKMQGKNEPEALENLHQAATIPMARLYAADILARRGEPQSAAGELRAYLTSGAQENRAEVEAWIARLEK